MACLAHCRRLKRDGGYTPFQLLFRRDTEPVEREPLHMGSEGLDITDYILRHNTFTYGLSFPAGRCVTLWTFLS